MKLEGHKIALNIPGFGYRIKDWPVGNPIFRLIVDCPDPTFAGYKFTPKHKKWCFVFEYQGSGMVIDGRPYDLLDLIAVEIMKPLTIPDEGGSDEKAS